MKGTRKIYVLADGHLGANSGGLDRLLGFIAGLEPKSSSLVFLGDLFHVWAGPKKYHSPEVTELMQALQAFDQAGGEARLVVGNRDVFFKAGAPYPDPNLPFVEISPDFLILLQGEKKLLFTHGDLVNSQDVKYLKWRKIVRSKAFRLFFAMLPSSRVKKIMFGVEGELKKTNQAFRLAFPEEEWQSFIAQTYDTHPFDLLMVGHFHPAEPIITPLKGSIAMVLPDWLSRSEILQVNEDCTYEFIQVS